jgi:hypothetical protein
MNEQEHREFMQNKEELARIKREYLRTLCDFDEALDKITRIGKRVRRRVQTQRYGKKKYTQKRGK